MIETLERSGSLTEQIAEQFAAGDSRRLADALSARRTEAMQIFDRLGIPGKKAESWKYTAIAKALKEEYELVPTGSPSTLDRAGADKLRLPDLDAHLVVVVNGMLRPDLSDEDLFPEGVEVSSLLSFIESHPDEASQVIAQHVHLEEEPFAALNTAFKNDGLFVRIPEGVTLDRPLQVAFVTDLQHDGFIQPRNLYLFAQNSEAMLVETFQTLGEVGARVFNNPVTEIIVERDARINVLKLQLEADHASRIDTTQVVQTGQSHFAGHTYSLGGKLIRNNMNARPSAPGCETHLYGLYILGGEQHVDNHTLIDHAAAGCFSNELYRGIVDEHSTGVFNGKVFVRRDSQQTNAYQSSQGVVLSENAHHFSKPELEIYADDVKCSHGSTTGELEPEHVFYLRSRGLDEVTAKSLLLYAFARDIVDELPHEALRNYLDNLIEERLVLSAQR